MDVSPAEETLLNLLRGGMETDFALSVTRTEDVCVISVSTPSDGVLFGAGAGFEDAFLTLCGRAADPDAPLGGEAAPRPSLTIVGGTEHGGRRVA